MGFGGGSSGSGTIGGASDAALNNPTNNDILTYDSGTSKWKNATASAHTHAAADIASGTLNAARLPAASESVQGAAELATAAEATTGTDTSRAVTPAGLKAAVTAATASLSLEDLADVGSLPEGSVLTVTNGDVIGVTPEDVTAADIEYLGGQSVRDVITQLLSRVTALETAAPILVNSVLPVISGTFTPGSTVSVSTGTWTVAGSAITPDSYLYQWKRNGANISGATNNSYTLVSGDLGNNTITVAVTARKTGNTDGTVSANAIDVSAGVTGLSIVSLQTASNTGTSIPLTKPSNLANGDFVIAALRSMTNIGSSDFSPVTGSGTWSRLGPAWPGAGDESRVQGFYGHRISDVGSEPASYQFIRTSAATRNAGVIFALRGVPTSNYLNTASTDYFGTSITGGKRVTSLTVTANNSLQLIVAAAEFAPGSNHAPITTPAGFTLLAQEAQDGDISSVARTFIAVYYRQVNSGATAAADITWTSPVNPVAHSIVINPGA